MKNVPTLQTHSTPYVDMQLLEQVVDIDIDRLTARLSRDHRVMVTSTESQTWKHEVLSAVERYVRQCSIARLPLPNVDTVITEQIGRIEAAALKERKATIFVSRRPRCVQCIIRLFFKRICSKNAPKAQNNVALHTLLP